MLLFFQLAFLLVHAWLLRANGCETQYLDSKLIFGEEPFVLDGVLHLVAVLTFPVTDVQDLLWITFWISAFSGIVSQFVGWWIPNSLVWCVAFCPRLWQNPVCGGRAYGALLWVCTPLAEQQWRQDAFAKGFLSSARCFIKWTVSTSAVFAKNLPAN